MPFQRKDKHGFRRSRSRSPYDRHQSFRRSRSPRNIPRRRGSAPGPRDFGRRQSTSFKDRGRRELSPPRRSSPKRYPPRRSSPRRSPTRRSPDGRRDAHSSKQVQTSFSREKDSGSYRRDSNSHQRESKLRSRSPLRGQDDGSEHMDPIYSQPNSETRPEHSPGDSETQIERSVGETKPEPRVVRKRITLTERYSVNQKAFELEENITIGLQRNPNIPISTVVNVENKEFDFNKFTLKRRHEEGSKPIFDREEIKAFRHDEKLDDQEDFERRVITVLPSKKSERRTARSPSLDVDYSVRKSLSSSMSFDDRQLVRNTKDSHRSRDHDRSSYKGEKIQITRCRTPSPRREQEVRLDPRPDPRYEAKYRVNREREERSPARRVESISHNPRDLRHSIQHRRINTPAEDARFRIESKRYDQQDVKLGHGRDAWDVANEYDRDSTKQSSSRQKGHSDDLRNVLPDFSKREGRFQYEEWKDKPEMVPKGQSYFEHDNREDERDSYRGRGRGRRLNSSFNDRRFPSDRGGYRPRPYTRGFSRDRSFSSQNRGYFRPRGRGSRFSSSFGSSRRSSVEKDEWKHDMYDKLEKDDDNCPTSTT